MNFILFKKDGISNGFIFELIQLKIQKCYHSRNLDTIGIKSHIPCSSMTLGYWKGPKNDSNFLHEINLNQNEDTIEFECTFDKHRQRLKSQNVYDFVDENVFQFFDYTFFSYSQKKSQSLTNFQLRAF